MKNLAKSSTELGTENYIQQSALAFKYSIKALVDHLESEGGKSKENKRLFQSKKDT